MKIRTTWKIDFDVITDIGDTEPTKELIKEVSQINEEVKARIEDAIGINDLEKVGQIENKNLMFISTYEMKGCRNVVKYFIQNNMGDKEYYETDNIVDAIYKAWNIEGCLWLGDMLVFDPFEDNETLSNMLKVWGLRVIDHNGVRKLQDVATEFIFTAPWQSE